MKLECIWLRDWTSLAELQRELSAWRALFNERRPATVARAEDAGRVARLRASRRDAAGLRRMMIS